MNVQELSLVLPETGNDDGQSISASTTTAASSNAIGATQALIYSTVEVFAVKGASPTATVASGVPIPAYTLVRATGLDPADKLAVITSAGSGTVYIRPGC